MKFIFRKQRLQHPHISINYSGHQQRQNKRVFNYYYYEYLLTCLCKVDMLFCDSLDIRTCAEFTELGKEYAGTVKVTLDYKVCANLLFSSSLASLGGRKSCVLLRQEHSRSECYVTLFHFFSLFFHQYYHHQHGCYNFYSITIIIVIITVIVYGKLGGQ